MNHRNHNSQETTYICPMCPNVKSDKPGLCPNCGMNLVKATSDKRQATSKEHGKHQAHGTNESYGKHAGHSANIFKARFWVSFVLSVPVVLYSDIVETLFGFTAPAFTGSQYVPAVLASIIFFYGGWIFIQSAVRELRARMPGMMTLIALAVTTAYIYSIAVTLLGGKETLYWELATLITIMLLGHWMEMRAVQGAQGALRELSKLLPDMAEVVMSGQRIANSGQNDTKTVSLSELREGDIVIVRPGGKIPVDGEVSDGSSEVNESMVTGESKPVSKKTGDKVIAGTINGDGALYIRVTQIGEHTFLAGVMRLVAEAQASKSRLQILSDRAAFWLTIVAISAGAVTFVSWSFAGSGVAFAITRLVAVLVIACPHALGLAIPLVASISTSMAAKNGFLVRQRMALEAARNVDVVLFDKTGTLTTGEYGVEKIWALGRADENDVLRLAASVDLHSEHYIARAIVAKAKEQKLSLGEARDFVRIPGKGVKGTVDGATVHVGGAAILDEVGVQPDASLAEQISIEAKKGKTIVYIVKDNAVLGAIALADLIREESRQAVRSLQSAGVKVAMVTGDSDDVAKWVADDLGIDEYFSRVLPDEKSGIVKQIQEGSFGNWKLPARPKPLGEGGEIGNSRRRRIVAMVGDGINDAPALTQADVGIAIGAGTNVAIESAGIILVRNDPRDIARIITLSRLTYRKMIQNLFWATGYNVVALPLAAGALAFKGIVLEPALAAVFMSLSTVIVAANAVMLKRKTNNL